MIPPPNVTGVLHMGHLLNNTLQDIMVRRARQEGHPEREDQYARALERRDRLDSTREDSPLRRPDDAELIETDGLAPEDVVDRIVDRVLGGARA